MPEDFHFLRPAALLLAPVAAVVWWWCQRRADPLRGWRAQIEPELLAALVDRGSARKRTPWPLLAGWLLAVVALAGPSWRPEPSPFADDATPLVILLKADVTMDTPDPAPSRLERARLKIKDLAEARKGQPLGLIAYAGSAHLVLPPTRDTATVASMAGEISSGIMPEPGDRLDLALARAAEVLDGGSILVITDTACRPDSRLATAHREAGGPDVQILAVVPEGGPTDPLQPLAKTLKADLVEMTSADTDIERIVRKASRAPVARNADGGERWQDGGYLFLPVLAALALLPFRRESKSATRPDR